ncbi:MAG: mechanosensitive ion channel family protein [Myxococcales bacterium]|nr:mechanosensitive ion channel family protein [Myxococcales bacterium]
MARTRLSLLVCTPLVCALLVWALLVALPSVARADIPKHITARELKTVNPGLGKPPQGLDRSTPNRSWSAFLRYCSASNWDGASHLLALGDIRQAQQRDVGAATARKLCAVLKKINQLTAGGLPDTGIGPIVEDKPSNYAVTARVPLPDGKVGEVWIRRFKQTSDNSEMWLVTRKSVSFVSMWYRLVVQGQKAEKAVAVINSGLGALPPKLDVGNPRATANTFRNVIKRGDYDSAARLLDLRGLAAAQQKKQGRRLARRLALLIERVHPGSFNRVSNDPLGAPEKDVPDNEEVVVSAKFEKLTVELRLTRIERTGKGPAWLFSQSTVQDIDRIYGKIGYGWAGDFLPPLFFNVSFWKLQLWQWIGLVVGLVLAWFFGLIGSYVTRKILLQMAKATKWEWDDRVVEAMDGPLKFVFAALALLIVAGLLILGPGPRDVVMRVCKLFAVLGLGWFLVRTIDVAGDILKDFFNKRDDEMGKAMVPVARRIFKPIMVLVVLIVALQNAGVNVAGLIAGLGIGGLALAMAAKSTLENMLGGITIAFDRPFKVGDTVTVGTVTGAVEEVGLRSTRIRTADRTLVTLPNSKIVDSQVENYAPRDRIRLTFKIGLQYDTSPDQIRFVLDAIKRYMVSDARIYQDGGFRIRLNAYADSAIELDGFIFAATTDFNLFTVVKEDFFFRIGEIVEEAGAQFAFPTRTIYTGKASEADAKRAKAAASVVHERREAGELCIPEIPEKVRADIIAARPAPPEEAAS